jgi:hypothetical protein
VGVGAGYKDGMTESQYKKIAWSPNFAHVTFSALIASKFGMVNKNLAAGGCSNQMQFRIARNFFVSNEFAKLQAEFSNIIVMWGITTTARIEVYNLQTSLYDTAYLHDKDGIAKIYTKFHYDRDVAIDELATEMLHWNEYFQAKNIKNMWFDTFDHHEYQQHSLWSSRQKYLQLAGTDWPSYEDFVSGVVVEDAADLFIQSDTTKIYDGRPTINNLLFKNENPRDLLSKLAILNGMETFDTTPHKSSWISDTNRVDFLVGRKILNPYSHHPTEYGHQLIAGIIEPEFNKILGQ